MQPLLGKYAHWVPFIAIHLLRQQIAQRNIASLLFFLNSIIDHCLNAASVAYAAASARFALTCLLGGVIACWNTHGEYAGLLDVPKVSGTAAGKGEGFASNALGEVYRGDLSHLRADPQAKLPAAQWNNHPYLASARR